MLNICILTDGGHRMGMGHVQQSMTLARSLQCNADIFFLTKSDDVVVEVIREGGFHVIALSDDDEIFSILSERRPDVIVFDKIDVSVDLVKRIRGRLMAKVVIFTNLTAANDHAHMVVLPRVPDLSTGVATRFENIVVKDATTGRQCFYGPKYWVLRPEFLSYKKIGKEGVRRPKKLLLAFGGSDPTNLTSLALEALITSGIEYDVDVILGRHFSHFDEVKEVLAQDSGQGLTVTFHRNVANVAELMYEADLAITAAGMSMFEALCVGTPVIVIPQDQLQRDTYQGIMRLLEVNEIAHLPDMIDHADFTRPSDEMIAKMEIGDGVPSLVDAILDR